MSRLPMNWIETELSNIAAWGSGGTPSRSNPEYYGGSIPWIKTGELGQRVVLGTEEKITELGLKNSSAKIFPKGSVAVAMYGATIGKTSILGIDASTNQACGIGIPFGGVTTSEYLYYYLASQKDAFIEAGKGGAQPNISQAVIKTWPIPLAPLPEQKRIADKLDTVLARVDTCRERLNRVPLILKRFRQSLLAAATSGLLTADWRGEGTDATWSSVRLGELLQEKPRNGYSPKTVDFETPVRSLTLSATTSGRFRGEYCKFIDEVIAPTSYLWLEPGDILIQRANSLEYVGVSAVFDGPTGKFIYPDLMMKCRANDRISTPYLHIILSAQKTRDFFRNNATGTAGNMPKINQQTVLAVPVQLPPLEEQQEIVRRVETLFAFADRLEARLTAARTATDRLTPALLAKAFRGELVPQGPNDEPAAELLKRLAAARTATSDKPRRGRAAKVEKRPSDHRSPVCDS